MEDRSEDPELRIAEGSWWPGGGSEEEVPGECSSSILPAEKMEDGKFFVLRAEKVEDGRFFRSSEEEVPTLPPSSARSSTHSSGPKIEDGGFFDLRLRRSKIEDGGSSIFGCEDRRLKMEGVLRSSPPKIEDGVSSILGSEDRRLKMEGVLRSSGPKIENGESSIFGPEERRIPPSSKNLPLFEETPFFEEPPPFFEEPPLFFEDPPFFEELPPSFFVLRVRRSKNSPHLRSSEPKIGSKIAVGHVVNWAGQARTATGRFV